MRFLVTGFVGFWICVVSVVGVCASEDDDNLGQTATHPHSRLDLRIKYQQMTSDRELVKLTARVDQPISMGNGWKLNTRVDQGFFFSDLPGSDNPDGETDEGFGDLETQAFFIPPSGGNTSFGFGSRAYFPTATQDQFGTGKYRLVPFGIMLHFPTWLPQGSFAGLGIRDEIGFGGDGKRDDIHELQIVPVANIRLPAGSFVSFFPEIRRDWKHDHAWFVPFDVEVGRAIGKGRVGSLRFQIPIINEQDRYIWTLEARVTFLF